LDRQKETCEAAVRADLAFRLRRNEMSRKRLTGEPAMRVPGTVFCCAALLIAVPLCDAVSARQTVVVGRTKWLHLSTTRGDLPAADVGRQVAALIHDIDKDGHNDFVIASYEKIVWYRYNTAKGDWTRYWIEKGMPTGSLEAGGDFYDIDGGGAPDLVMGSGYGGKGGIWRWRNPYPNVDPNTPWERHLVLQVGRQHHDQIFGDFEGTGRAQLAFFDNPGKRLYLAEIPPDPKTLWPYRGICSLFPTGGNPEGFAKADISGDGKLNIVGGGWWFEHVGGGAFTGHPVNGRRQFSRCAVARLIKGGRPQILLNSGDGVGPLEMYQWDGRAPEGSWIAKTLIERVDHGHTLQVADIDGDGNLDIYAAEMYKPGPGDRCRQWVLYGNGKGGFDARLLSTGIGSHESKLGDLDGDGRIDILQKDFQQDRRVDIWLNQGPAK